MDDTPDMSDFIQLETEFKYFRRIPVVIHMVKPALNIEKLVDL